jgi:predicted DNA-binding protein
LFLGWIGIRTDESLDRLIKTQRMQRLNIQFPRELKAKLDALRKQGTTASGLIRNLVERWFREITDKRIRRGVFRSVPELIAASKII